MFRNAASIVVGKPRIRRDHADVAQNCWEAHEAQKFLIAAKAAGPRPAAFYAVALDSGARKGELCGLQWSDLDFDKGTVRFVRQLIETDAEGAPVFGPIKNDMPRTVDLSSETIVLQKTTSGIRPSSRWRIGPCTKTTGSCSQRSGANDTRRPIFSACRCRRTTWGAGIRADHQDRERPPDFNPRAAAHERDIIAQGWCRAPCRAAASRPQTDRNDSGDLRARVAVDAAGRGTSTGSLATPLNRVLRLQLRILPH